MLKSFGRSAIGGLFLAAILCKGTAAQAASPLENKVIVNEWGQSSAGDWVEVLVTQFADIRGMWVCDSGGPDLANGLQFSTTHAFWSGVKAGTLIVFYDGASAPAEDFDKADFKLVMNAVTLTHPEYFDATNKNFKAFSAGTATDNPRLFDGSVIPLLLHDWDQGDAAAFTGALRASASGDSNQYNGGTATGVSNAANWTKVSTGSTPGLPNGGANTTWIQTLRATVNSARHWSEYK